MERKQETIYVVADDPNPAEITMIAQALKVSEKCLVVVNPKSLHLDLDELQKKSHEELSLVILPKVRSELAQCSKHFPVVVESPEQSFYGTRPWKRK